MKSTDFASFLELVPDGAAAVDGHNRVRLMNRRARELLGAPEQLEGLELKLGDPSPHVRTVRRFDGGVLGLSVRTSRATLEGEEMLLAVLTPVDDERARQAVRLAENMSVFDHDHLTDVLYVSPEHRVIFGLHPEAVVTLAHIMAQVHPDDRERVGEAVQRAHDPAGNGIFDIEYRIVRPDGEVRWLSTRSVTTFEGTGPARHPVRTAGAEIDVTRRRSEETAMRTWAQAVASSANGLAVADLEGRLTYVNSALLEMWGLTEAGAIGQHLGVLCARPEACHQGLTTAIARGQWSGDFEGRRGDGSTFPTLASLSVVADARGKPANLLAVFVDITQRVKVETELRRLANVLDATPDVVSVARLDRQLLYINQAARRLRGLGPNESLAGHKLGETLPPDELANIEAGISYAAEHGLWRGESKLTTATGELLELSVIIQVHGEGESRTVSVIARDTTPQRRLESQLRQSQKMEAIGQLAGGVAHDFNNLLTVINANAELLLSTKSALAAPQREDVETILEAGRSAAELTRQLLIFSRKQLLKPVSLDLNELVSGVERMLRRVIGEDVDLATHLAKGVWPMKVDRAQMEQVLLNLAVNARDAMPEGGKLTIETGNVVLDEEYARQNAEVIAGDYVLLAVTDDGVGMTPEVRQRIFEPFFSTKGSHGTGLGLSTVYGIVKQSGGHVSVYSEPGQGTTFRIYLPRNERPEAAPSAPTPGPRRSVAPSTILVVEDAAGVRELIARFLEKGGHRILSAATPEEALTLAAHQDLALVITDVVLPGMSGRQLVDALKQTRPDLKVLFMSGYTENSIVHRGVLDPDLHFIAKPFTIDAFSRLVEELLPQR